MKELNKTELKDNAEVKKELVKYLTSVHNQHSFNINGAKVKVVFSTEEGALDLESALVKIASNRGR